VSGKKICVLGGLGFIGSHICRALVAAGADVRTFGKFHSSRALVADIEHRLTVHQGDVTRAGDVLAAIAGSELVIDLIHTTVPGSSMQDPGQDVVSNVAAAARWLVRLPETDIQSLLYVSSGGTVYGVPQETPISEDHPTNPVSSYGITKLASEKYVAMYAGIAGVRHCVVRPSNVYGPGQRTTIGQGVIGVMARRALAGQTLEIWGSGESIRDYLYIDDMVSATLALLEYDGDCQTFNISSGAGVSVLEIVSALRDALGGQLQLQHTPDRGFDVPNNVLDSSRLQQETGWRASVDLAVGIQRTVDHMRQ